MGVCSDVRLRIAMIAPPPSAPSATPDMAVAVTTLAAGLAAIGHQVTLVDTARPAATERASRVWDRTLPELLGDAAPDVVHMLNARCAVRRLVATDAVDIVHDHTAFGPLNAGFCQTIGVPVVTTIHGNIDTDVADHYRTLGHELNLVAVSELQRQLHPDLHWIGRVPNAVDIGQWPLQVDKQNYALFLGRFDMDDAPHLAVRIAREAAVPLVMAGPCVTSTENMCFREHVLPSMDSADSLFGQADTAGTMRLLAGARCLLVPAGSADASATAITAAMACGTPVVGLDRHPVNEAVVDRVTGILCRHPAALADGVRQSGQLDPLACRRHVADTFGAERIANSYVRIYHRILAGAARAHLTAGTPGLIA